MYGTMPSIHFIDQPLIKRKGHAMIRTIGLLLGIVLLWVPGSEAKDVRFPEIAGWKQSGEIQTFIPKTLYEYINGAADLYLACDFEGLQVAEYGNEKKASVTVEVYRHRTPKDAFGIYSRERLPEGNFLGIGAEGYVDKNILNFLSGRYYVKINSYNTGDEDREVLQAFAVKVAENLGERGGLPAILSAFPAEGKKGHSEKYIARNFLGYSFFNAAFTADYDLPDRKFKLFLIESTDKSDCKNILQQYLRQIKISRNEPSEGRQTISDPHHGIIDLYWKGRYIWGTLDLTDADLRSRYLKLFENKLGRENKHRKCLYDVQSK
jgi:hypothetical protein